MKLIRSAVVLASLLLSPVVFAEYSSETIYQVDVGDVENQEIVVSVLTYEPGHKSDSHRHHAHIVLYVLEGTVKMAVAGSETLTLGQGEVFVENPDDIHTVSMNASETEPAKALVFWLKTKGAPSSVPAD